MNYQVTIRYGRKFQRYHSISVEGTNAVEALRSAADQIPSEIAHEVDIVELREAPDFDKNIHQEDEG